MRKTILISVLVAMLSVAGCTCVPKVPPAGRPNVVVVMVDTLRFDAVKAFGGKHETPIFDGLVNAGVRFDQAYSPASWTVPAVASLLLGMYPQTHGLYKGAVVGRDVVNQQRIPESYDTLAEVFQQGGYETFGVSTNSHISKPYGYSDGFDHFAGSNFLDGRFIELRVRQWMSKLAEAAKGDGYFLYLHWTDPHFPYFPRKPFINKLRPNYLKEAPRTEEDFSPGAIAHLGFPDDKPVFGRTLEDVSPDQLQIKRYFEQFPSRLPMLHDLYTADVQWCSRSVGKTLLMLPEPANTIIVFVADHGEAFHEHNSMAHGIDLYQETVHVPLSIVLPNGLGAGTRIDEPVSLIDIAPTLASLVKITPSKQYEGRDLSPMMRGEAGEKRQLYSHLEKGTGHWRAIFESPYKLMIKYPTKGEIHRAEKAGNEAELKVFLFDLENDPGETNNLVLEKPEIAVRLAAKLEKEMSRKPIAEAETVGSGDKELKEKMRSVGYL